MKLPDPKAEPNSGDVQSSAPVDVQGGDPSAPRFDSRLRLLVLLAFAALLWWLPAPAGLEPRGWHLLGLFLSTIMGFVLQPLPMGPLVLLALSLICLTRLASLDQALAGYADHTVWLVVAAFLLAGVVRLTGLGRRIALNLICRLGHTLTGLGHAICASELILGPVVPSNTARGGGILAPLVQALAQSLDDGRNQAGRYLALVGAHANLVSAAMFLTGMAANPLVAKAASEIYHLDFSWSRWALGALVPGLTSLLLLPLWLGWLIKLPKSIDTSRARQGAAADLNAMGAWSWQEKTTLVTLAFLLLLWASKPWHGLDATLVAWLGLLILIASGVQNWFKLLEDSGAFDTLIWLGGLLTMGNLLKEAGVVDWFAGSAKVLLTGAGLQGLPLLLGLALLYFYSMYGFSMLTAHISALIAAFMTLALAAGSPPLISVALLAYCSDLCACLTPFSSGPVIIYFGLGYTSAREWFRIGFLVSLFHLLIWFGLGLAWWKLLGWW